MTWEPDLLEGWCPGRWIGTTCPGEHRENCGCPGTLSFRHRDDCKCFVPRVWKSDNLLRQMTRSVIVSDETYGKLGSIALEKKITIGEVIDYLLR